jgi:hypothetical protein
MFKFDQKSHAIVAIATGRKMCGLHRFIEGRFCEPGSGYRTATIGKDLKAKSTGLKGRKAMNFGKLVDSQMQRIIEYAKGDVAKIRACVAHKTNSAIDRMYALKSKQKYKNKPRMKLLPYTAVGLSLLIEKGLIPVASQVYVGNEEARVATAADLECNRAKPSKEENSKAVVETKCGYDRNWKAHSGRNLLNLPCQLKDSAQNKAHLQALCTALLYKSTFSAIQQTIPDVYVLHLHRKGAVLEPLLPELQKCVLDVWKVLTAKLSVPK